MSSDNSPGGSQTSLTGYPGGVSESEVLSLPNMRLLEINDQIRELQTTIRDKWVYVRALSLISRDL